MDYDKYKSKRWGISERGLRDIAAILDEADKSEKYTIFEFGSGFSTMFFVDYCIENDFKKARIVSYENSSTFAARIEHSMLESRFRPLLHCNDENYEKMFREGVYMPQLMEYYLDRPTSRQKNCFYKIHHDDIPDDIDFVLLDGPNGNGRNIAWLHLKGRLRKGAVVFIDDYDHYDFLERFGLFFNYKEIKRKERDDGVRHRDSYVIAEIQ